MLLSIIDHYSILELPPSATPDDIKKAWRKLAQQYHPDKNADNAAALIRFEAIKEAYETLSNPEKKMAYLQERWLAKAGNQPLKTTTDNPDILLRQLLEFEKYSNYVDSSRMDKDLHYRQICYFLSDDKVDILQRHNDPIINNTYTRLIIKCCKPLTAQQFKLIAHPIARIVNDTSIQQQLQTQLKQMKHDEFWEKWRLIFVLLIVILLCSVLFYSVTG